MEIEILMNLWGCPDIREVIERALSYVLAHKNTESFDVSLKETKETALKILDILVRLQRR